VKIISIRNRIANERVVR